MADKIRTLYFHVTAEEGTELMELLDTTTDALYSMINDPRPMITDAQKIEATQKLTWQMSILKRLQIATDSNEAD